MSLKFICTAELTCYRIGYTADFCVRDVDSCYGCPGFNVVKLVDTENGENAVHVPGDIWQTNAKIGKDSETISPCDLWY